MAVVTVPQLAPATDEALVERYLAGERLALDELFRRYRQPAYRVAIRLLGNEADALDALQDGFVKVLTTVSGFQGKSAFKTWLMRVVSNAALDIGRTRARRQALANVDRSEVGPSGILYNDPASGLERSDLRRQLEAALARLPDVQRQTIVLHAEAEMSYREIADAMGISIGTVMSRLFYARQKLKADLGPHLDQ